MLEVEHTLASPIPWRRHGIKHQTQECFFDISEQLSAIVDKDGLLVTADVWGQIEAKCHLSGMPDLNMSLTSPDLIQDCCFHPCVRLAKWAQSKTLSFVPPDGRFVLMEYRLARPTSHTVLPLKVKPSITIGASGGSFQLRISSTQPSDRPLENVRLTFDLGRNASNIQASLSGGKTSFASQKSASAAFIDASSAFFSNTQDADSFAGRWEFLPERGTLVWQSPRLSSAASPVLLQGTWNSATSLPSRPSMAVSATFDAPLTNVSGIQVASLKITSPPDGGAGGSTAPFKGVRPMMQGKGIDFRW